MNISLFKKGFRFKLSGTEIVGELVSDGFIRDNIYMYEILWSTGKHTLINDGDLYDNLWFGEFIEL